MRDRLGLLLALAAGLALLPAALLELVGHRHVHPGASVHFGVVALAAAAATGAALTLTIVGARRRDARSVLVGGAFSVMAALLCLHGITTPGVLVGSNGVVALTGGATLPVGGLLLAVGVVPALVRPSSVPALLAGYAALVVVVFGLGVAAVLDPALVPSVPETSSPPALALLAIGLACFGLLELRALRTYLLTRRLADLLVGVGIAWLAVALAAALLLNFMQLGWWLGHGFEVVGIFMVGVPVAFDLWRSAQSRPLAGDLRAAELVASEEAFLGSHVRALMLALAEKDRYTEEHTRRVAMRSVQVGEELGLPATRLRSLAAGGLLHDIGKLSIPDEILQKPGPLSHSEFDVVKEHPERGRRLLREVGGFGEGVLRLVRDHHERLDGTGYPHGAPAHDLDVDTRILTVCDVYDSLISERVYREAWSHERAVALLREGAGTIFDPRCVETLDRVLAREQADGLAVAV